MRLRELCARFLFQKTIVGVHDLNVTDIMRAHIAVKSCVPILELGLDYYSNFRGIVVYPGDFRVHERYLDNAGVVHEEIRQLCGQSLARGPMVLSWDTLINDRADDARDLVIHECAHKLDALNGGTEGFPPLHADMSIRTWTQTLTAAYEALCKAVDAGQDTRLDPYATENAAEFFAVVCETFFTRPDILQEDFPPVYEQLASFFRQDPCVVMKS